jgi:hypothetical protein
VALVNIMKMTSSGAIGLKLIGQHGKDVGLKPTEVVADLAEAEIHLAWEEVEVSE